MTVIKVLPHMRYDDVKSYIHTTIRESYNRNYRFLKVKFSMAMKLIHWFAVYTLPKLYTYNTASMRCCMPNRK